VRPKVFGSLNTSKREWQMTYELAPKMKMPLQPIDLAPERATFPFQSPSPASFAELPLRAALSATKNLGQTTFQLAAIDEVEFKAEEIAKTLDHICLWLFNEPRFVWVSSDPPI